MKYLIIVEKTKTGYKAYLPDLDGFITTVRTRHEVEQRMKKAIDFHFEGHRKEKWKFNRRTVILNT